MCDINTIIKYPLLTMLSIGKKSFENMGRCINKSGDTISRLLKPASVSFIQSRRIAQSIFANKKSLYLSIDDTLIKKIYSKLMWGSGRFYDTKIGRCITAYRLMIGMISDGKNYIPIDCAYLFAKELIIMSSTEFPTKDDIAKLIVEIAIKLFPNATITVVVDGLYSTVNFLTWCKSKNIRLEARMHSNRVVEYNGESIKLKDLLNMRGLCPKGRQEARTISIVWHNIDLELTIVRRFDKNGNESIVFQISTYKSLPREHVANYKKRWSIEMLNRTTKQALGLQECYSRSLEKQHNHVASVLLAYSLAQLEMKISRLDTPEKAIRHCKTKSINFLIKRFTRLISANQHIYA